MYSCDPVKKSIGKKFDYTSLLTFAYTKSRQALLKLKRQNMAFLKDFTNLDTEDHSWPALEA